MILYSNNCPKCNILKSELNKRNIQFRESKDFEVLELNNILSVPVLDLEDGTPMMLFKEALDYVRRSEE